MVGGRRIPREFGDRVEIAPPQVELFDGLRRVESLRINPLGVCEQVQPEIPGHLFDEFRQAVRSGGSQQPGMPAQAYSSA